MGLTDEQVRMLVADICRKKELQGLSLGYVERVLRDFLRQNSQVEERLAAKFHVKSAVYEKVLKGVRAGLRRKVGLFGHESNLDDARELMHTYFNVSLSEKKKVLGELLLAHSSTRERVGFARELYQKIFISCPEKILDLGCGLHPLSVPLMGLRKSGVQYFAYDIHADEMEVVNEFFGLWMREHKTFRAKAGVLDLLDVGEVEKLPEADIALLFKVVDVLDANRGHTRSEALLRAVPSSRMVVSFATKTMSGRKMTAPRRRWMEWMCSRLGWKFMIFEFENEIFYVIEK